jgi:hypothetical protein
MASWILQCRNCGLPFQHSAIEATVMNFFSPSNLIFRGVEADFNALTVGKPRRINALTFYIELELPFPKIRQSMRTWVGCGQESS